MKASFAYVPGRKTLAAVLLLAASAVACHAQTTQYSALSGTPNTQPTVSYAQQLTFAGGANQSYLVSGMTLNLYQPGSTTLSYLYVDFYTGANTSPTAADALDGSTFIADEPFQIAGQSTPGTYMYLLNTTTGFTPFNLNTGTVFVSISLYNTSGGFQSTSVLEGSFSLAAPTVGTNLGFVWNDSNNDTTFAGSEQTTFGAATASIGMTINASIVPEPGTNAALACGGLVLLGGWALRRRRLAA